MKIQEKILTKIIPEMKEIMVDMDIPIMLIWYAAVTKRNFGMFGPPGNAKSLEYDTFKRHITGSKFFYKNCHSHMKVEELIDAVDIPALQQGRFERNGTGFLQDPDVRISMLDEIGRAKSVKSVLLPYLNERIITVGKNIYKCNVISTTLASNSEFTDTDDEAFNNRIAFRAIIKSIKNHSSLMTFGKTWHDRDKKRNGNQQVTTISVDELDQAYEEIKKIQYSNESLEMAATINIQLFERYQLDTSNRLYDWFLHAMLASCWFAGRSVTTIDDCEIGKHMLWQHSDQMQNVHNCINSLVNAELDNMQKQYEQALSLQLSKDPTTSECKNLMDQINSMINDFQSKSVTPRNRNEHMRLLNAMKAKKEAIAREFQRLAEIKN